MAEGLNKLTGLGALMKSRQIATTAKPETQELPTPVVVTEPQAVVKVNPLAAKLGKFGALKQAPTLNESTTQVVQVSNGGLSLDDLAESEDMGEEPADLEDDSNRFIAAFDDETPAEKPMREIPEDCTPQMKQFIGMMDDMYGSELRQDLELLSGMIRSIMVELKSNPQYIQQVRKEDIRTWVQAMRQTMGLAKIKKAEKQEKRKAGGTGSRGGGKAKKQDDVFDDAFAELGIDLS